jgi:hypothetical protein
LLEREATLRELAEVARWVDKTAFGDESSFGHAYQALLKALNPDSEVKRKI